MENLSVIKKKVAEIKKLIETNDPYEEFPWLNDIYVLVEDIEVETIFLENDLQCVIDAVKDLE